MPLSLAVRRALANALALLGALALIGAAVALVAGRSPAWGAAATLLAAVGGSWWVAFRLRRSPRSRGAATGHVILYETPLPGVTVSRTPPLTVRGARDAVERFIPLTEFEALFGGWALWAPPARPTADLPGEALGVWSRRTCSRFRRVLRERGAEVELRREPGPEQRIAQLVSRPHPRG